MDHRTEIQEALTDGTAAADDPLLPLLEQGHTIAQRVSGLSRLLCRRLQSGTDPMGLLILATAVQSEINALLSVLCSAVVVTAPDHDAPPRQSHSPAENRHEPERTHGAHQSGKVPR